MTSALAPLRFTSFCQAILLALLLSGHTAPIVAQNPETPQSSEVAAQQNIGIENTDAAIGSRLAGIYANLEGMENVQVRVEAGVVNLSGAVIALATRRNAEQLALSVEGVVSVNNELSVSTNISTRLQYSYNQLVERLGSLLAGLPFFLIASLVVVLSWFLARAVTGFDFPFSRMTRKAFLADLYRQITRVAILLLGVLLGLQIMDAMALVGAIVGAAGLFGLAMGFAMRDTVENYIASILLSVRQPFAPQEIVAINEQEGQVVRLTSRATILMNFDGNHIRIPNAQVYKAVIINYTRNPQRRFRFEVGVSTEVDLDAVRALAMVTLAETPGVMNDPPSGCLIKSLGDSSVILTILGWTDQSHFDFLKVRSAAIQRVKEAFDEAGFEMPEPIYRVNLHGTSQLAEEAESASPSPAPQRPKTSGTSPEAPLDIAKSQVIEEAIRREAESGEDLLSENSSKE